MKNVKQSKFAHSYAYLIGNIVLIFLIWFFLCFVIWFSLPYPWGLRAIFMVLSFFIGYYVEYNFLTGYVAKIVEFFVQDDISTKEMQSNNKYVNKSARRKF